MSAAGSPQGKPLPLQWDSFNLCWLPCWRRIEPPHVRLSSLRWGIGPRVGSNHWILFSPPPHADPILPFSLPSSAPSPLLPPSLKTPVTCASGALAAQPWHQKVLRLGARQRSLLSQCHEHALRHVCNTFNWQYICTSSDEAIWIIKWAIKCFSRACVGNSHSELSIKFFHQELYNLYILYYTSEMLYE